MKKFAVAMVLSALVLGTAACSGSSDKSAKALYTSFSNHYNYLGDDFGFESEAETFEDYVAGLEDCEPVDGEGAAMVALFVGPTLVEHGDDVAGLVRDLNELMAALRSEGLCK